MKKSILTLIILASFAINISAQNPPTPSTVYATRLYPVYSLPAICRENQVVYHMLNHQSYVCTNAGWKRHLLDGDIIGAITSINGLTNSTQTFAVGTSGTNFNISSTGSAHTFNFPNASATNRGLLTSADWTIFNNKQDALGFSAADIGRLSQTQTFTGAKTFSNFLTLTEISTPGLSVAGTARIYADSISHTIKVSLNGAAYVDINSGGGGGGGAPVDATYITQVANGALTNEQALSTLSSGIMRVANSSGLVTSLTDSAGIASNISDESGTGSIVFNNTPTITGLIINNNATLPTPVIGKLAVDTDDTKLYYAKDGSVWGEVFVAGLSTINLASANVTGILPYANGGTGTTGLKTYFTSAGCNNATASTMWDLPTTTPAVAACVTGTNTQKGVLDFADTSGGFSAQNYMVLPPVFSALDINIYWTTTATTGNAKWSFSTSCTATNATEVDDTAFNTVSTVTTAAPGTANRVQKSSISSVTITGCSADEILHFKIFRDGNDAADTIAATARLLGVEVTIK